MTLHQTHAAPLESLWVSTCGMQGVLGDMRAQAVDSGPVAIRQDQGRHIHPPLQVGTSGQGAAEAAQLTCWRARKCTSVFCLPTPYTRTTGLQGLGWGGDPPRSPLKAFSSAFGAMTPRKTSGCLRCWGLPTLRIPGPKTKNTLAQPLRKQHCCTHPQGGGTGTWTLVTDRN